jgi:hypothetical protein
MSPIAMIVVADMALGTGPDKVSDEVEKGLELRGDWAGDWWIWDKRKFAATVGDGTVSSNAVPDVLAFALADLTDDGGGKFRIGPDDSRVCLGIYRHDGDGLVLCYRMPGKGRPITFRAGDGQYLLVLHRVQR